MMLPGSGTIIDCEEVNGTYTCTILTSTTLLRSSPESNTLQDDMKVVILVIKVMVFIRYCLVFFTELKELSLYYCRLICI